ncbi:cytosine permease [Metabacillus sp. GX 13764]|uniref:purine-cytosine permease family protein n=1 Tax=Metabacillus kandeliae TaxID=2900151 RepID=UPI001E283731|nr:cytosine permease [Metabacillus kandeliae]MCD7032779.1 cytosine permease [Metabacillus kandeliae]
MATIERTRQGAIEKFGLESVPAELRKTKWFEYFIIQFSFSVNAGNVLLPALAVTEGHLSILQAFFSCLAGAVLAFFFVSYLSLPGARDGIPAQYFIRSILGTKAARFLASPIRSITSLYWFAVQTIGGTMMIIPLTERYFHVRPPFALLAAILSSIMILIIVIGFEAVKRATKYFLPVLLLGQAVILYLYFTTDSASAAPVSSQGGSIPFGVMCLFASLVFVQYISGATASADMTRYARSPKDGFAGMFAGNVCGFMMTAALGAFSAAKFHEINPFISAAALSSSGILTGIVLLSSILSMIAINLNNAYSGSFSLLNIFPALGRLKSAFLFGAAGIAASMVPSLVSEAKLFIGWLGCLIIPLCAVVVTDYLLIKQPVEKMAGFGDANKNTLIGIGFGMLVYLLIPAAFSPGFISFVLTSFVYFLLSAAFKKQ